MPSIILSACVLVALTVVVHTAGIALLLPALDEFVRPAAKEALACHPQAAPHYLVADPAPPVGDFDLGIVLSVAWILPNAEAALYFSGVTSTSLGYGDVVLAKPWRLLAPIEGLVGVIMCGLSTGYFFVVVSRIHQWKPLNAAEITAQGHQNITKTMT